MAGNARRFGISNDPDLELRLRRIEQELDKRLLSEEERTTLSFTSQNRQRERTVPPRVTGLSLSNEIVGGIGLKWTESPIPDLRRYELQISDNESFISSATFTLRQIKTTDAFYTFTEGDASATFYARVRAVNNRGDKGVYSATLNTSTGQANFNNLADGAASNIISDNQDSGFSPASVATDGTPNDTDFAVYLPITFETVKASEIIVWGFAKFDYVLTTFDTIYVRIRLDGVTQQEYENRNDVLTSSGRASVPGFGFPAGVTVGEHTIDFQIEVEDTDGNGSTTSVTPQQLTLVIWDQRN